MSEPGNSFEELFRDAAQNASSTPPPPPDWGTMSGMLKESAVIKAGGASKLGLVKAMAGKTLVKATAAIVITGGGAGAVYVATTSTADTGAAPTEKVITQAPEATTPDALEMKQTLVLAPELFANETEAEKVLAQRRSLVWADPSVAGLTAEQSTMAEAFGESESRPETMVEAASSPEVAQVVTAGANSGETEERQTSTSTPLETSTIPTTGMEPDRSAQASGSDIPSDPNPVRNAAALNEPSEMEAANPASETVAETVPEEADPTALANNAENESAVSDNLSDNSRVPPVGADPVVEEVAENSNPVAVAPTTLSSTTEEQVSSFEFESMSSLDLADLEVEASPLAPKPLPEKLRQPLSTPSLALSPYFSLDRSNYAINELDLAQSTNTSYNLKLNPSGLDFTAGLRVAYKVFPYLWLESGALYSAKSPVTGTISIADSSGVAQGLATYHLSGKMFEVPLHFMIRNNNGAFGWYAKAGVHLTYNYRNSNNYYEYADYEEGVLYRVEPDVRTLNPALSFGAGMEYNISRSFRFYAEPSFRYALRPALNPESFDQIPVNPTWSTLGLGFGINYYFLKNNNE